MITKRRIGTVLAAFALVALGLASPAKAQATRTWVSGTGDDVNPCSRTAPCKTFAGAISKTAAKGEINCLDPGGFGGVTITKSITISCQYTEGGVLAGGNGVLVNALSTDVVTLRGLDLFGVNPPETGIRIINARRVKVYETHIMGFKNGISFAPNNPNAKLFVQDTVIEENTQNGILSVPANANSRIVLDNVSLVGNTGNGLLVAPSSHGNHARAVIRNSAVSSNGCGVSATSHGLDTALRYQTMCGTLASGPGGTAVVNIFTSEITDNDTTPTGGANGSVGVFSNGANSFARIGANLITGNVWGVRSFDRGTAGGGITSFGDNYLFGNVVDGTIDQTMNRR
jgi:hypothetical protein